jgi:hypothetical protein
MRDFLKEVYLFQRKIVFFKLYKDCEDGICQYKYCRQFTEIVENINSYHFLCIKEFSQFIMRMKMST